MAMEVGNAKTKGLCETMCPRQEIMLRTREKLVHPFELTLDRSDKYPGRLGADEATMVKEFSRPAAGRADTEPRNLRPAPVLKKTVTYLYETIIPKEHPAWNNVYDFVFDRLRAVRQDMVIQGIVGVDAIELLEKIVRFHLYAAYRLQDTTLSEFDPVINKQHLLECLKRLLYLYQVTPGKHEHRVEMESVYLLDNLGDVHAMTHYLHLDPALRKSPLLFQCYRISDAYVQRNYVRALRLIWKLPCAMCLCAVSRHLHSLHINFLQILSSAYSVKNCRFPVHYLTLLLYTDSEKETNDLCMQCGLIDMFDNTSQEYICFNKASFHIPKELKQTPSRIAILDKMLQTSDISYLLLGK
ncbi:SAC3 domain-containing protein 1-like [Physella acuta]|uniref:SAC3 domain-containing protein 1-like n=1 Tax=Physella acuta TaxID=109671 RepID=UPI0027DE0075|nr:SAC3 domain-containing protein 1-like [Physella acuta]XP_059168228.1 SAC3 domain-containing protein 1-like [Physella acuta]